MNHQNSPLDIKVKSLHPKATIPAFATKGAACFDLHAVLDDEQPQGVVNPFAPLTVRTGLAFEVPAGSVMLIFSRSGHGFKNDIRLANCVGVIDSDYRGEVQVKLTSDNCDGASFVVGHGDRIAQAMIVQLAPVSLVPASELSETERGDGGFGSTGK